MTVARIPPTQFPSAELDLCTAARGAAAREKEWTSFTRSHYPRSYETRTEHLGWHASEFMQEITNIERDEVDNTNADTAQADTAHATLPAVHPPPSLPPRLAEIAAACRNRDGLQTPPTPGKWGHTPILRSYEARAVDLGWHTAEITDMECDEADDTNTNSAQAEAAMTALHTWSASTTAETIRQLLALRHCCTAMHHTHDNLHTLGAAATSPKARRVLRSLPRKAFEAPSDYDERALVDRRLQQKAPRDRRWQEGGTFTKHQSEI